MRSLSLVTAVSLLMLALPVHAQTITLSLHGDTLRGDGGQTSAGAYIRLIRFGYALQPRNRSSADTVITGVPFQVVFPHTQFDLRVEAVSGVKEAVWLNWQTGASPGALFRTTLGLPITLSRPAVDSAVKFSTPRMSAERIP